MAIEKLDKDEVADIIQKVLVDSAQYTDGELQQKRTKATEYYLGDPFGNEEDGRSKMVLTEVRDAISGMLPSILRVFTGGEHLVEFVPSNAATVQQAEQVTEYIMKVLEREGFFMKAHTVLLDGLVRALGAIKWGYDSTPVVKWYNVQNVPESALEALTAEDGVTLGKVQETKPGTPAGKPDAQNPQGTPPTEAEYTVQFTRKQADGCFKIWPLPPEEFIFSREARDVQTGLCVAHRTDKTKGELLAMGVSQKDIDKYSDDDTTLRDSPENVARREVLGNSVSRDPQAGEANDKIPWTEAYITVDTDGDGTAELRKFLCIGKMYHITNGDGLGEPVNSVPMAAFCPYPEPHTIAGQGVFDRIGPLQLMKSMVARSTLDSLALSIFPRIGIVEGQVNQGDVLNTDIGAPIRMRNINAIQPISHDFVGREGLNVMAWVDEIVERRTGQSRGATGLDADAMQSTTQEGVGAQLAMSQQHIELICRVFAEQVVKPLMKGMYELFLTYRPKAEMIRLSGEWVEMDPRLWDADLDVSVNVALGTTDSTKKLAVYSAIYQEQSGIVSTYGPSNPMCGLPEMRHTLEKMAKISGIPDLSPFFKPIPDNWTPPPPPPDKPTPEEMQVQGDLAISHEKNQRTLAIAEAKLELDRKKAQQDYELEVAKMAQDFELRRMAIVAQWKVDYSQQQFAQDTQADEQVLQGHIALQDQAHAHAVSQHDQALKVQAQQHAQQLAEQQQQAEQAQAAQEASQQSGPTE